MSDAVDPRIRRTRELLDQALENLLKTKEFDRISVQEIADAATVNRATFYDHYTDKFALLECLVAQVELRRPSHDVVLLEAQFEAKFEQYCVVTLEPVRSAVSDNFSLVYGPPPEKEAEIVIGSDEPAFEPLIDDVIDVGEAVAQELSLALPVSPRHPDADAEDWALDEPLEGPFAALAHLNKDGEC